MAGILVVVPCGRLKVWSTDPLRGATKAEDAYISGYFKVNREYAERARGIRTLEIFTFWTLNIHSTRRFFNFNLWQMNKCTLFLDLLHSASASLLNFLPSLSPVGI